MSHHPTPPDVTHGSATGAGQGRCPRESGYHMSLWTTKLVRHFIYTRVSVEHCRGRARQLPHARKREYSK
jgi:hypothetical protein